LDKRGASFAAGKRVRWRTGVAVIHWDELQADLEAASLGADKLLRYTGNRNRPSFAVISAGKRTHNLVAFTGGFFEKAAEA